jgi:hypothetical protein
LLDRRVQNGSRMAYRDPVDVGIALHPAPMRGKEAAR